MFTSVGTPSCERRALIFNMRWGVHFLQGECAVGSLWVVGPPSAAAVPSGELHVAAAVVPAQRQSAAGQVHRAAGRHPDRPHETERAPHGERSPLPALAFAQVSYGGVRCGRDATKAVIFHPTCTRFFFDHLTVYLSLSLLYFYCLCTYIHVSVLS